MKHKKKNTFIVFLVIIFGHLLIFYPMFSDQIENLANQSYMNETKAIFMGRLAKPTESTPTNTVIDQFKPKKEVVIIKHIPTISDNMRMPHPYWGECSKCHLFKDKTNISNITPWGKTLQKVSNYKKVGPAILPNSDRPHPEAGRCIKCHDIMFVIE